MARTKTRNLVIWIVAVLLITTPIFYWFGRVVLLYAQVPAHRDFWLATNKVTTEPHELIYVALGDSTAQGIGVADPRNSYPYLVKQWLEAKTGKSVKLINLSVSGAKLSDALATQLGQLKQTKADIVTIEIGANDIRTFDPKVFSEQFKELVTKLPTGAIVSDVPRFGARSKNLNGNVIEANKIISQQLDGSDKAYAHLYDITSENSGLNYYAADFFHPNGRAYKNWAIAFEDALRSNFPEKSAQNH